MYSNDGEDSKPPAVVLPDAVLGVVLLDVDTTTHVPPHPPSSVHGEVDEDDDNWSRQVEGVTSDFRALLDNDGSEAQHHHGDSSSCSIEHIPSPQQPELTMKEKLVLRERQRRIETERARLKRQFALSGTDEENYNDDDDGVDAAVATATAGNDDTATAVRRGRRGGGRDDDDDGGDISLEEEGTLGEESTRAHPDDEESAADDTSRRLGFNMERFLRNSDSFNPQLEPTEEQNNETTAGAPAENGVVMERFLSEPIVVSASVVADESCGDLPQSISGGADHHDHSAAEDALEGDNGSFFNGVGIRPVNAEEPHRSVSFDVDVMEPVPVTEQHLDVLSSSRGALAGSQPSFGEDIGVDSMMSNASVQSQSSVNATGGAPSSVGDPLTYSASMDMQVNASNGHEEILSRNSDEPRVLRLTEADMQEMASIEEASIGNAPPSDRDEEESLSEIGELADFGGGGHRLVGGTTISQDTPTTTLESFSQISGNQSPRSAQLGTSAVSSSSAERHDADHAVEQYSVDGTPSASDPSQYLLAPGAISVAANPPSGGRRGDHADSGPPVLDDDRIGFHEHEGGNVGFVNEHDAKQLMQKNVASLPDNLVEPDRGSAQKDNRDNYFERAPDLVNRQRHHNTLENRSHDNSVDLEYSPTRQQGDVVEGFDFDKDAPRSPFLESTGEGHDSLRDLPGDPWSPAGKMNVSPLHAGSRQTMGMGSPCNINAMRLPAPPLNYGAVDNLTSPELHFRRPAPPCHSDLNLRHSSSEETSPLLAVSDQIPPEITTRRDLTQSISDPETAGTEASHEHCPGSEWVNESGKLSIRSAVHSVFSEIRSESEGEKVMIHNESEAYQASSILARAFPERQFALLVTMILEIPVLLMIAGGSDSICQLVGRSRYQLLMGFLPLVSAISGNVGLQASTLTTRAISHSHVTEVSYMPWFLREVGAAVCLGSGMGVVLGSVAFVASRQDLSFAITIFVAQFISIVTAGVTGTFAPLLFSFIFKRDSGKWGGPLETAIQDIVGSFAMVVISYRILLFLGSPDVDPSDACFPVNSI